jgi:diguanylate cyclase (GGDEF)-like protein
MTLALPLTVLVAARVLANRYQRLRQTAYRDPLTRLNSRRFMDEFIPAELARAARLGHPVTALFIDIDHFKQVNDHYGHAAGDVVLQALARRLNGLRREGDFLCRWGGEEFALFMFGQGLADAQSLAERMRASVAAEPFPLGKGMPTLPVTISIGVAALAPGNDSLPHLIAATDQALYAAKSAGRNRVMTARSPAEGAPAPAGSG